MDPCFTTILVVDDEESDRYLIERALRENGVTAPIFMLEDGLEAVGYLSGKGKYADRNQYPYPNLILIDLKMPRGDGFTVLAHLKKNPRSAIIPTIVFTASSDEDDITKCYLLGATAYHVKPQNFSDLQHQLKLLHDYWMSCKLPRVEASGDWSPTRGEGKLGERFADGI